MVMSIAAVIVRPSDVSIFTLKGEAAESVSLTITSATL